MRTCFIIAGAPLGWLLAVPLLAWGDHLLAHVAPGEAAPGVLTLSDGAGCSPRSGATSRAPADTPQADDCEPTLPLAITPPWRWALRGGLAVLVPLALWRAGTATHGHLSFLVAALGLIGCVACLALIAVMDGAAHLIFPPVVALPALLCALLGLGAASALATQLVGAASAGGIVLALYLTGRLMYGTDALGFGDVLLATTCGMLLGGVGALRALVWGLLLLALTVLLLLAARRITPRTYIPLGTFIVLGALLALLTQPLPWR